MRMIEVNNLEFTYPRGTAPAVRSLTFAVAPGEILGFLGPSGAGKSTTQKVLIGLLRGYRGQVRVFGRDVAGWHADYYERIGVSFEFPNHYLKLSAIENLTYFRSLYARPTAAPQELLDLVGLGQDGAMPVGQFSKGMKNRLSVARALLHNPDLLFLDEPTAGLDPVNAQRIKELIRAQKEAGCTVFLTTHDMAVADGLCDRVAFLVDGQIVAVDTPRALKLRYGRPSLRVEYGDHGQLARREFDLHGLADDTAFLDLLRGGTIQTLHTLEATLDDVFIRVTGRSLN